MFRLLRLALISATVIATLFGLVAVIYSGYLHILGIIVAILLVFGFVLLIADNVGDSHY